MDNTKKANRWLSHIQHCQDRAKAIVAEAEQARSAVFLTHCQERLEFLTAREQVLTRRLLRLQRKLTQEVAEGSKKLLDKLYDAAKEHGMVILTREDDGSVQIKILKACAEKK